MSEAGSAVVNRKCATCTLGTSYSADDSERACVKATMCAGDEYEHAAPTLSSDRGCSTHTVCEAHQFTFTAATATSDG